LPFTSNAHLDRPNSPKFKKNDFTATLPWRTVNLERMPVHSASFVLRSPNPALSVGCRSNTRSKSCLVIRSRFALLSYAHQIDFELLRIASRRRNLTSDQRSTSFKRPSSASIKTRRFESSPPTTCWLLAICCMFSG
jgi:hypothetical protein